MMMFSARSPLVFVGCSALLAACSTSPDPAIDQADLSSTLPTSAAIEQVAAPIIVNPGFENEWEAWDELPDGGDFTAISDDSNSGSHSAKITDDGGRFEQTVAVQPNTNYEVSAYVQGAGEIGVELPAETRSATPDDADAWLPLSVSFNTGDATEVVIYGAYESGEARLDDFAITPIGGS